MSGEQQWRCEQAPMIPDCHKPVEMGKGEEYMRREIANPTPGEGEGPGPYRVEKKYRYGGWRFDVVGPNGTVSHGRSMATQDDNAAELNRLTGEIDADADRIHALENCCSLLKQQLAAANERVREIGVGIDRIVGSCLCRSACDGSHCRVCEQLLSLKKGGAA